MGEGVGGGRETGRGERVAGSEHFTIKPRAYQGLDTDQ